MRITHSWTDATATISVEGLTRPVRLLHVTDTHMGLIDDRDPEHVATCRGFANRFLHRHENRDAEGNPIPPEDAFSHMMIAARSQEVDLIGLTGDIVHFPSQANVDVVLAGVEASGVPTLYTAGNHDWLFPTDSETANRTESRAVGWTALARLYEGEPAYEMRDIGGVRILSIDDSTYQIDEAQLEFTRKALGAGLPTIILMHIPLSVPTLRGPTLEKLESPILVADPDSDLVDRGRFGLDEDTSTTLEFVRLVAGAANLVAILCGHLHFPHTDAVSPHAVQYLGPPGYAGESRLVELRPL